MNGTSAMARPATSERVLSFSPRSSVGMLFVRPIGGDPAAPWDRLGEARWSVLIPKGMEVRLWVNPKHARRSIAGLRKLAGDSLAEIVLLDCPVNDQDLRHLRGLATLRLLDLFHTKVTDDALTHVATLTRLEWLSFTGTRIGDAGGKQLGALTALRRLSLKDTDITDESVATLAALPHLEWLSVSGTQITDVGLRALGNSKSLRALSVHRTQVSAEEVRALESRRSNLALIQH